MFSRKFPFYKSREASDGEPSDVERKYSLAWRRGLRFACLRPDWSAAERELSWWSQRTRRGQLGPSPDWDVVVTAAGLPVQKATELDPCALSLWLSLCNSVSLVVSPRLGSALFRTPVTTACPEATVSLTSLRPLAPSRLRPQVPRLLLAICVCVCVLISAGGV